MAAANPQSDSNKVIQYMDKIKESYKKDYTFSEGIQIGSSGNGYEFYVKTVKEGEPACHCVLYIDNGEYSPYNSRSGPKSAYGIKVNSIYTHKDHTGKRLGIALLFYSICWLYIHVPDKYEYIRLDDATNGKSPLDPDNFYIKLGFVPEGRVALPSEGKILVSKGADEVKVAPMNYFIKWMLQHQLDKLGGRRKKIYTKHSKRTRSKSKRMKRTRKH